MLQSLFDCRVMNATTVSYYIELSYLNFKNMCRKKIKMLPRNNQRDDKGKIVTILLNIMHQTSFNCSGIFGCSF